MKKLLWLPILVLCVAVMMSVSAFAGETANAEGSHDQSGVIKDKSLEEVCSELSAQSDYEYAAVYAEMSLSDYYPSHYCPRPEKCKNDQVSVYADMKTLPPFSVGGNKRIFVYTKLVPEKEYWSLPIPRYFKGRNNKFCARKILAQEFLDGGFKPEPNYYKIDHLETIQPYYKP